MDEEHVFVDGMFNRSINYRYLMKMKHLFFAVDLAMREKLQREGRKGASWETEQIQFLSQGCCIRVTV